MVDAGFDEEALYLHRGEADLGGINKKFSASAVAGTACSVSSEQAALLKTVGYAVSLLHCGGFFR